jgi:dCMP deaminase
MPKQVMLYLPVLHRGYEQLLDRHAAGAEVMLLGTSFGSTYAVLRKEIRALVPSRAAGYVRSAYQSANVRVVEEWDLPSALTGPLLVMPDEQLMREIAKAHHLSNITRIKYVRTFLRWDRKWSAASRPPDFQGVVTVDALAARFANLALDLGNGSSDWWRQVGAVAVREGQVVGSAHNEHVPSEYAPYLHGDPRSEFKRGISTDVTTALHAEAAVISRAARHGVSLEGADLYVSTFPCPACARLIAAAGFVRCFFAGGYSLMDGQEVLQRAGVEIVFVDLGHAPPCQLALPGLESAVPGFS